MVSSLFTSFWLFIHRVYKLIYLGVLNLTVPSCYMISLVTMIFVFEVGCSVIFAEKSQIYCQGLAHIFQEISTLTQVYQGSRQFIDLDYKFKLLVDLQCFCLFWINLLYHRKHLDFLQVNLYLSLFNLNSYLKMYLAYFDSKGVHLFCHS